VLGGVALPSRTPCQGRGVAREPQQEPPALWLPVGDQLLEFESFEWRAPVLRMSQELEVTSRSVADLILRTVQLADDMDSADTLTAALEGSAGKVVFRHQRQDWVVDADSVVHPRH
jgi:uncharacterized membrane-anchored protein